MKIAICWLLLPISWLLSFSATAQLQITSPVPRMVFQRNLRNEATLLITGIAPAAATVVEARLVPLAQGQGNVTAWTRLALLPNSAGFRGFAKASAGWYRLDVRTRNGTTPLAEAHVNRVGVGEVFVTAGQSNMSGGFQRVPGAVEDRVSCIDFRQDSLSEQLLPLQFSHISYGTSVGPSQLPHIWGILGDKLVRRLNVPVLFIGAALAGTTCEQWRQSAAGAIGQTPNSAVYRRLGAVLLHYVRRTGARAVLWHQGEGDISTSTQTYYDNIRYVIEKSRQQLSSGLLPWVVSRVSYVSNQTNPGVIAAQNQLINTMPAVFAGPATDNLTGIDNRPDGVHFGGNGLYRFTDLWDQSLTDSFFETAIPFTSVDTLSLLTSGYTLPLTRRPGETLALASLRSAPVEADNQYVAQLLRTDNWTVVLESARTTDNPILLTLPTNLPDGQYQYRIRSTHPALTGALSESFTVRQSATASGLGLVLRQPTRGGTPFPSLLQLGYRYEPESHSFYAMVQSTGPVEVRLQRTDGGSFNSTDWAVASPSAQAPDYTDFADFSYLRNYPPTTAGVGGVSPGRYRLSVRPPGDTSSGLWHEMTLLSGRTILYYPMESIPPIPPVLTLPDTIPCLSPMLSVAIDVTDGNVNSGNVFSVRLSDAQGSFTNETILASSQTSPVLVTLPTDLSAGIGYRLRVVASNPAVASAPSPPLTLCGPTRSTDLSLAMFISNRLVKVRQPVTVTLVLTNAGDQPVKNVQIRSLLPKGLRFIDTPSSAVSALSATVSIRADKLAEGASLPFVFRVQPDSSGSYVTSAQITAASLTDPDSQPDSGTGDGQDDAVQVAIRTIEAGKMLTVSPNPGQVPLPVVQSDQPLVNPSTADVSLIMTTSSLLVSPGELVSLSLTVSNRGGGDVGNLSVQTQLPTGWVVTNPGNLTINGSQVRGALPAIKPNETATLVLTIQPTGTGTVKGQLFTAAPTDPDSSPGNGYTNGEDDEASLTLRSR